MLGFCPIRSARAWNHSKKHLDLGIAHDSMALIQILAFGENRTGRGGGKRLQFIGHTDTVHVDGWGEHWQGPERENPFGGVEWMALYGAVVLQTSKARFARHWRLSICWTKRGFHLSGTWPLHSGTRKNLILEQCLSHNLSAIPEIISRLRAFWGFLRVP